MTHEHKPIKMYSLPLMGSIYVLLPPLQWLKTEEYIIDKKRDRWLIDHYTETNLLTINENLKSSTLTLNAFCLESSDNSLWKWLNNDAKRHWKDNDVKWWNTFPLCFLSSILWQQPLNMVKKWITRRYHLELRPAFWPRFFT